MDYIESSIVVISALISSVALIMWWLGICRKDIVIKHKIDPYGWFVVHAVVDYITILLMLIVDMIQVKSEVVKEMPVGVKGAIILFVQKGGLIILVMLMSSWLYDRFIKINEFSYFIKRYPWIKKVFYSLIYISLVLLYLIEIQEKNDNTNILSEDYSFIALYMISFIQIWIGFGMEYYEWDEFKNHFSEWVKRMKNKEELKSFSICILSVIIIPTLPVAYSGIKEKVPESAVNIIQSMFLGISFGTVVLLFVVLFWNLKYNPSNRSSKRRLNNCLNKLFNNKRIQIEYYEGIEYCVVRKNSSVILIASIDNITFDVNIQFDEYRERLEKLLELFEREYSFEKYTEEEIRMNIGNSLSKLAKNRKDILKEGWNKVYEVCEQKEKEK